MATQRKGSGKAGEMRLFTTRHDLEQKVREQIVELCNAQLADTFALYALNKQSHWNVKGRDFYQLHEMFDDLAEAVLPFVDILAERITALGGQAMGTVKMAAAGTRLADLSLDVFEGMQIVETMAERYAAVCESTRKAIDEADKAGDADTADVFTEISRELDKHLYFLESHLQSAK